MKTLISNCKLPIQIFFPPEKWYLINPCYSYLFSSYRIHVNWEQHKQLEKNILGPTTQMPNTLLPSQIHWVPTPDVGAADTQSSACFQVSLSISQMLKLTVAFIIIYHTKRIVQT